MSRAKSLSTTLENQQTVTNVTKSGSVYSESGSGSVVSDCLQPHGLYSPWILQARILEWVASPFCRGSSQPRDQTQLSCIAGRFFTS